MTDHPAGGIILLLTYIVFTMIGETIAYFVGRQIEASYPVWSLAAFLVMFLGVIIIAWPLALRATAGYGPAKA